MSNKKEVSDKLKTKPRELKAIEKGQKGFASQDEKNKIEAISERELKKLRMYEELFSKKEEEAERKRRLKEKRDLR